MIKLQALTYIEGLGRTGGTIWNNATDTLTPFKGPDTMQNRMTLSISTAGMCLPVQVVKQPEHRRASITKEQKLVTPRGLRMGVSQYNKITFLCIY